MRLLPLLCLTVVNAIVACGPPKWKATATTAPSSVGSTRRDYFEGAWPDNRRLEDGRLPTLNFPNPSEAEFAVNLFKTADKLADGFGTNAPMYVPFSGPIDVGTLPQTPEAFQSADASVYVVAIDPASPVYGKRAPLEAQFFDTETPYLRANTLALRPFVGVPLEAGTTYAIIVTTKVKDGSGAAIGADEPMWTALWADEPDAHYAPLRAYLDKEKIDRTTVALGVVFRTQTILDELLVLRDYLASLPDPTIDNLHLTLTRNDSYVYEGDYAAPYLLHGTAPYELDGGDFRYDEAGAPVVAKVERMRIQIVLPRTAMPATGWPVVMYSHGTGGAYDDVGSDIGYTLAKEGIASVGIDQVLHGPRGSTALCLGQPGVYCFFNPVNAKGGRNLLRQAALDHVTLKKLLATGIVPASVNLGGGDARFDPAKVGFFGHSQGGLTGAIYLAIEHDLPAVVLSGTGGHLTSTVLLRTDPIDLRALAETAFLGGADKIGPFHPALAMMQTLGEVSDPLNYGRRWLLAPDGRVRNLYMTSGLEDPYTPAVGAAALAAVAGLPQWEGGAPVSPAHAFYGIAAVKGPVKDNLQTPTGISTGVFRQFPMEGHFPVFDTEATAQWKALFVSAFTAGGATIP